MKNTALPLPTGFTMPRKAVTICLFLALVLCSFIFLSSDPATLNQQLVKAGNYASSTHRKSALAILESSPDQKVTSCPEKQTKIDAKLWNSIKKKTDSLLDDKFTILLQTYRRPDILGRTLNAILGEYVPSLLEVHIIWNDPETPAPENFVSKHGVPVIYRQTTKNSLNEKLRPNDYRTKAVLLHDDDVYYHPADMEFVFQTWRKKAQDRVVGAFARMHVQNAEGVWELGFASEAYSVVMTGLVFVHIAFTEYYWTDDPVMTRIRDFVDHLTNCEDVAMNMLVSAITCQPPLQINGVKNPSNEAPAIAISTSAEHPAARIACMNDLPVMFGAMPLINTTESIKHGQFDW
ncbi:unnamed protein product [Clonostachys byssicola]|uniref:Glycosyl transferase 64 domain-containing protein n=1 Tax=Clonostachys byssicola TaxID=160290 RepID=A0A9N9ULZ6_9HYPO|nr:unnamed protein product [Clonostachys byssicola]